MYNMRKVIVALLVSMLVVVIMSSCTDETIGGSIADVETTIVTDSSFTITGLSYSNTHIQSRSSRETSNSSGRTIIQLLGVLKSNGYGTLTSDVVTQFMPTEAIDISGTKEEWIDSCRLAMRIPTQGFTGDSLVPMRLNVYKLNKQLPNPIYSDFDVKDYYSVGDLIGTASYSANALMKGTTTNSLSYRTVYVPLPVELGRELYRKYQESPETFKDPRVFAQYFPGLYIANSYGSGRVMRFYDTEVEIWYKKEVTGDDGTTEIEEGLQQTVLTSTPEVLSNNNIKLVPDPKVESMIAGGDAIVMGPAGYDVEVEFPIYDVISNYIKSIGKGLSVINSLSMSIPVELVDNDCEIAPPKYLMMVKSRYKDEFFAADSIVNDKTSFYATYDATKKSYEFTNLRQYILDVVSDGFEISRDDYMFTLTPVDIDFYTSTSGSYYYGYTSSTSITKVSPGISVPSIAKLRLDKAKIKLTFSRQSI